MDIEIIGKNEHNYPKEFTMYLGSNCPGSLYYIGDISLLGCSSILVCGARNASETGCELAYKCGRLIAEQGYTVISGYARGIDSYAHLGALEAGGTTVAILPYGLSKFKLNQRMAEVYTPNQMLVVSEVPHYVGFSVQSAMRRNKLLVASACAVIVVEPGEGGGTWYTAKKAKEMGKPLYFLEGVRPEIIPSMKEMGGKRIIVKKGAPNLKRIYCTLGAKVAEKKLVDI